MMNYLDGSWLQLWVFELSIYSGGIGCILKVIESFTEFWRYEMSEIIPISIDCEMFYVAAITHISVSISSSFNLY